MPDLETVDLEGVEIMAAGERVRGVGSPKDGEVFDVAKLEQLARDTNAVLDLVQPWATVDTNPIGYQKVGHNPEQAFLKASGLYRDDRPATGWLHNLRVDGEKLVSDIKDVPKGFADLIKAKAFRRRSTELVEHTSTVDGEKREVVGALAWLGARRPAFQTLADVAALYADEAIDADSVRIVVEETQPEPPADSTRRMPDTDHTLRSFAEAVGLEGEASSDQILDAVKQLVADKTAAETKATEADEKVKSYADAFAVIKADAEQGKAAHEELRVMRRDRLFHDAVQSKRIAPAQVDDLVKQYDESPIKAEAITVLVGGLQPRTDLTTPDGRDADEAEKQREAEKAYALFEEGDE